MNFFPLQITLRLSRRLKVGHHPAAMVAQMLKAAVGEKSSLLAHCAPDPVEVGRMQLDASQPFVFGITLWNQHPHQCRKHADELVEAIRAIGQNKKTAAPSSRTNRDAKRTAAKRNDPIGLAGNFALQQVQSLVDLDSDQPLPVPDQWIEAQAEAARQAHSLTLRWLSPLQAQLPRRFGKRNGKFDSRAGFFDSRRFPLPDLARRLLVRLNNEFPGKFADLQADDGDLRLLDPQRGRAVWEQAARFAEQLKLHLNDEKTKLLDLEKTPFDFLGFRFFSEKGWQYHGDGLCEVEDLGWQEAPRGRPAAVQHALPGESAMETKRSGTWLVGPGIDWVGVEGPDVVCRNRSQGTEDRFQRRRVAELIVLGPATLDHSLLRYRTDDDALQVLMADDSGRWTCALTDQPPLELPGLVRAQAALAGQPHRCLELSRRLVAAKLRNHAVLASTYPARGGSGKLSEKLRTLAGQAGEAADLQQLLGIEGAGGAAWYGEFEKRIDRRFRFERRVHPAAEDPVNVMLNLTQTVLHRIVCLTLIREGFAPSLGIYHQDGNRHAALASDLQEPFRHLMDRVVIEATSVISPGEFHETGNSRFALRMEAGTYRTLTAIVFKVLATECVAVGRQSARSYRRQIATSCRSLHRHLLNPEAQFKVFEHY